LTREAVTASDASSSIWLDRLPEERVELLLVGFAVAVVFGTGSVFFDVD
jgi:hypothetical protein